MPNFDLVLASTTPARTAIRVWAEEPTETRAARVATRGGVPHTYTEVRFVTGDTGIVLVFEAIVEGEGQAPLDADLPAGSTFDRGWFAECPPVTRPIVTPTIGRSSRQSVALLPNHQGHFLFVMRRRPPNAFPMHQGGMVAFPFIVRGSGAVSL